MRMKKTIYFFIVVILTLVISCNKENPIEPFNVEHSLIGKIVDADGNPIVNAEVHYIPQFIEQVDSNSFTSAFRFTFSLPYATNLTVVLLKHYTRDTVKYLIKNEFTQAGTHSLSLGTGDLTNGVYHYVIKYDTTEIDKMIYLSRSEEFLSITEPFKRSDMQGSFQLSYKELGIGLKFSANVGDTTIINTISNTFRVVIFKENFQTFVQQVTVDTNQTVTKMFTLIKK